DRMRRELAEQRKKVQKLRGKDTNSSKDKGKSLAKKVSKPKVKIENESDSDIDINTLRKDMKLKKLVKKELISLGLDSSSSSSSSSSSTTKSDSSSSSKEESESSVSKKHKKKKKHSHKKKSGINAKASDKVKFPQRWPHAHLQFEHVNKQVKFDELDFKLFIAGELEIISEEGLPRSERKGRIELLKKIVYYSNTYDFKGLKGFYAAWLREIELGKKNWEDDSQQIESAILSKHIRSQPKNYQSTFSKDSHSKKTKVEKSDEEKVWFCSAYQRNKCSNKANHMVVVKGHMRMAMHICATCWQKDKVKLSHPECSSSCPHASP
ncbi:MAG: hypothetical protein AB2693_21270, partial [Candidatus Thiodiazotropha sp.]